MEIKIADNIEKRDIENYFDNFLLNYLDYNNEYINKFTELIYISRDLQYKIDNLTNYYISILKLEEDQQMIFDFEFSDNSSYDLLIKQTSVKLKDLENKKSEIDIQVLYLKKLILLMHEKK